MVGVPQLVDRNLDIGYIVLAHNDGYAARLADVSQLSFLECGCGTLARLALDGKEHAVAACNDVGDARTA
jgi:hypothetical protein